MLERFKKIIRFLTLFMYWIPAFAGMTVKQAGMTISLAIISPAIAFAWHDYTNYGDWDYYGSGRDHPYSAYIDRKNYIGYADYAPIGPDYIDGPLVISNMPTPPVTPIPVFPSTQPDEFIVNIPNTHGGYNAVVIKKSGDGGFIGPQGEYYPEFPKVFQLQMKYGK